MSHRKMICLVANDIGRYHRPQIYQYEILKRFGVHVSTSSVVKALGAWKNRKRLDGRLAEQKAKSLLADCFGDKFWAKSLIDKLEVV